MYLKNTQTNIVYPYSIRQLIADNPNTSFPSYIPEERLAEWGVFPVLATEQPVYDPITQTLSEVLPTKTNDVWVQTWSITAASPEQIAERIAAREQKAEENRKLAYQQEADPIFFKAQRGKATMEEWLAKITEIKDRFPS